MALQEEQAAVQAQRKQTEAREVKGEAALSRSTPWEAEAPPSWSNTEGDAAVCSRDARNVRVKHCSVKDCPRDQERQTRETHSPENVRSFELETSQTFFSPCVYIDTFVSHQIKVIMRVPGNSW